MINLNPLDFANKLMHDITDTLNVAKDLTDIFSPKDDIK